MNLSSIAVSYLAGVTARSLCLLLVAMAALWVCRVKSASTRHSVWALVVVGMMLLAALNPAVPPIPLRILRAVEDTPALTMQASPVPKPAVVVSPSAPIPAASKWKPSWSQAILALYLAGAFVFLARFLFGYFFTRKLVHSSGLVGQAILPAAAFQAAGLAAEYRESIWISAPMTVGWIHPKVLLPMAWREWDEPKLQAVLTHELTHVHRGDWLVAALAGLNRSLFWFHPLAWWLDRRLAILAEQACDDSALLALGNREQYASALLDMAAAVKSARGRLVWHAIAMAEPAEVGSRIDRILDETRPIPRGLTRARRLTLTFCSLPLLYLISVLQFAPPEVLAQEGRVTLPAYDDPYMQWVIQGNQLTAAEVDQLEKTLAANSEDLAARGKVISYYYSKGIREPRLTHIWWLIEHHPESPLAGYASSGISSRGTRFNNSADYDWTRFLWLQQIAQFANDPKVLASAVRFFSPPYDDYEESERLLKRLRILEPNQQTWSEQLASLYASVISVAAPNTPTFTMRASVASPAFVEHVKGELENSTDGPLLSRTSSLLATAGKRLSSLQDPQVKAAGEALTGLANRLSERSYQFGMQRISPEPPTTPARPSVGPTEIDPAVAEQRIRERLNEMIEKLRQAEAQMKAQAQEKPSEQQNGAREAPRQAEAPKEQAKSPEPAQKPQRIRVGSAVQAAMLINKVDPVYPDVARQESIEGKVKFTITIAPDGHVSNLQLLEGHPVLVAAAQEALNQWVYRVTRVNGEPVEVVTQVEVVFSLPPSPNAVLL